MEISLKIDKVRQPGSGGAREGAGRKKKENSRNIRVSFMLSAEANLALQKLAEESGKSKNDVINTILERMGKNTDF